MKLQQLLLGSAAVFAASVWTGMELARPAKQLPRPPPGEQQQGEGGGGGSCAFDRLASVYDSIIGAEERYMMYGLLRWWLLRNAQVCAEEPCCLAAAVLLGCGCCCAAAAATVPAD